MNQRTSRFRLIPNPSILIPSLLMLALAGWLVVETTGTAAQASATVEIDPASSEITLGEPVELAVAIRDAEDLAAFQFTLTFPPDLLEYQGIDIGPFLAASGRTVRVFPPLVEAGKVTFVALSSNDQPGSSGDGVLADVRFRTLALGSATVGLSAVRITDSSNENRAQPATNDGSVVIKPEGFFIHVPLTLQGFRRDQLPTPVVPDPPTEPPPSSPTPVPSATRTPTPTPDFTPTPETAAPRLTDIQCYGRAESLSITNQGGAAFDIDGWEVRSTTGNERYVFRDSSIVNPGETLKLHSGPGAPLGEDRLNKLWSTSERWNNLGDGARLSSPRPNVELVDEIECPTPVP